MCLFVDSLVGYRRSTWLSVVAVGSSAMRGTRSGVLLASFPPFSRSPFSWSPLFFVPFCGEKWVAAVPFISRTFCTVVTLSRRTRSRRSTPTSDFGRGFLPDVTLVNCSVSFLCVCVWSELMGVTLFGSILADFHGVPRRPFTTRIKLIQVQIFAPKLLPFLCFEFEFYQGDGRWILHSILTPIFSFAILFPSILTFIFWPIFKSLNLGSHPSLGRHSTWL